MINDSTCSSRLTESKKCRFVDKFSLEGASMETFGIPIAAQVGIAGAVETPSRENCIEQVDKIVAKRDEFIPFYSLSHKMLHESQSELRRLKALGGGIDPFYVEWKCSVVETRRDRHRKAMALAGDIVAWMWRLKMALWHEVGLT